MVVAKSKTNLYKTKNYGCLQANSSLWVPKSWPSSAGPEESWPPGKGKPTENGKLGNQRVIKKFVNVKLCFVYCLQLYHTNNTG